ncbi:hypothetical protein QUB56_05720 [Microcoleus sp. AR_TQ3_B6]|uniref:hypothetical protein n=1 Tax=Microcoleus sp. AR_TQ3_B6 TaxID=3055284 RepID=UPI002FD1C7CA
MARIQICDLNHSDSELIQCLSDRESTSISGGISVQEFLVLAMYFLNTYDVVVGHWDSSGAGFLFGAN